MFSFFLYSTEVRFFKCIRISLQQKKGGDGHIYLKKCSSCTTACTCYQSVTHIKTCLHISFLLRSYFVLVDHQCAFFCFTFFPTVSYSGFISGTYWSLSHGYTLTPRCYAVQTQSDLLAAEQLHWSSRDQGSCSGAPKSLSLPMLYRLNIGMKLVY